MTRRDKTKKLLSDHLERYPLMEITDCVKLLYQSEFAGGHIIGDSVLSLERLKEEWALTTPDARAPLCVEIGGGLCRLQLAAARARGISPEEVNAAFVATANANSGSAVAFEGSLSALGELCAEGKTPFTPAQLTAWLAEYRARGGGAAHHSETFRANYSPRYRVIAREYLKGLQSAAK